MPENVFFSEFNYSFKWVDDQKYGKRNQETGEWNGMMGELLAQVTSIFWGRGSVLNIDVRQHDAMATLSLGKSGSLVIVLG